MLRNNGHFSNGAIPAEIAENLKAFFPEFGDLNHDELLEHQEIMYQSLKGFDGKKDRSGQTSDDLSRFSWQEGESSQSGNFDAQLALDEAIARSLQGLEDDFADLNMSQSASAATEYREVTSTSRETPVPPVNQNAAQDEIEPDNLSYEELQSLGDSIGSVNKGLSPELISRLPNSKYKTRFLSKKQEKQECVICCMMFKNGDMLTSLPCTHRYHSTCINKWLVLNKHCPVCQKEVSED